MVNFQPKLNVAAQFEAFKADTVVWENGRIIEGEKLWTKGKNTCVILARSRLQMLYQILCLGEGYAADLSGCGEFRKMRATPFQYMQLGDGTACPDPWHDDLVSPLVEPGQTYGGSKRHRCDDDCMYGEYDPGDCFREPWLEGSWRLSDFQDCAAYDQTGDSTTGIIRWWQWYHFGTEHACDATVTEWGLFGLRRHVIPDIVECDIRQYLNRNHLDLDEQFYKGPNMIVRAMVTIELGF